MPEEAEEKDVRIAFADGALARRANGFLPDGDYFFEDQLNIAGSLEAVVITCEIWLLEIFEIASGKISFAQGAECFTLHAKRIGVLYPPFSIVKVTFENTNANLRGLASKKALPDSLRKFPAVFELSPSIKIEQLSALEILHSVKNFHSIEMAPNASPRSRQAKRLIDENYLIYPAISRIAQKIGVSPAHLSRQFKIDYGLSPNNYFNRLRVADAGFLMASGESIADVAQTVGYNDLSRFYKQFHKLTNQSPGDCRKILKSSN